MSVRKGRRISPLRRYRIARVDGTAGGWPPLAQVFLESCIEQAYTPGGLARRAGCWYGSVTRIIEFGSCDKLTLERLAPVMGRSVEELEAMLPAGRFTSPRQLASVIFRNGRVKDPDKILSKVLQRHPQADANALRRYLQSLLARSRGRGAALSYTNEQKGETLQLLDQGWGIAKIGRKMGFPLSFDKRGHANNCPTVRRIIRRNGPTRT